MAAPAAASYWSQDPTGAIFQEQSRRPESACVGTEWVILLGEWGEAFPAVGVLQSFQAPPNEFDTENLILLELSPENQSNYFLLPLWNTAIIALLLTVFALTLNC